MKTAKVSICLPTFNSARFLEERLESIYRQKLVDWELVAVDSNSDDGTFQTLQRLQATDQRVRVYQAPRDGIYPNFNRCIQRCRGEFVYIATSDDTMATDCLEKMVKALDENADCDLAHCPLKIINEGGEPGPDWWSKKNSPFAFSSEPLRNSYHIRKAPFDGLLHLCGESVYISITQLLIRRRLFDGIGCFESRWGSVGDFNWNMRASLVANTVHVPDTWGGWRMHPQQATAANITDSVCYQNRIEEMIEDALDRSEKFLDDEVCRRLRYVWARYARDMREVEFAVWNMKSSARRRAFLAKRLLAGSRAAREYIVARLRGERRVRWRKTAPRIVEGWLKSAGMESSIFPL